MKVYDVDCPYCQKKAELHMDSSIVYRKNYGPIYLCQCYPFCDSYVGCHPDSTAPLGRLANKQLRYWKKQAHKYFDVLWKEDKMKRSDAYKWLSEKLDIPGKRTHIGMFDVKTCKTVVELCKPYSNE